MLLLVDVDGCRLDGLSEMLSAVKIDESASGMKTHNVPIRFWIAWMFACHEVGQGRLTTADKGLAVESSLDRISSKYELAPCLIAFPPLPCIAPSAGTMSCM